MKKKIALINNNSKVTEQNFRKLLDDFDLTVFSTGSIDKFAADPDKYDLIIISGGSRHGLKTTTESVGYQKEIIEKTTKPIIGICLGYQMLIRSLGGNIFKLPRRREGVLNIRVIKDDPIFANTRLHLVYQSHTWGIMNLNKDFEILAVSQDGIEVVRHNKRPIYGMQFHPEIQQKATHGKLLFINAINELL